MYKLVNYNKYKEALKDYLAINLYAAIIKARAYYTRLNNLLAYYAVTILYL
jgi:hypothetical protein